MMALVISEFMEMVGYIGRIEMHHNPWDNGAFEQQVVCLILAPSFVAAGIYWSIKHITLCLSPLAPILPPRLYPWIFIGCDIASILMQAAGGGLADPNNQKTQDAGNNLMIAGVSFQVVTMAICGLLALHFMFRVYKKGPAISPKKSSSIPTGFRLLCAAEIFSYVTVLIRCIYRCGSSFAPWYKMFALTCLL